MVTERANSSVGGASVIFTNPASTPYRHRVVLLNDRAVVEKFCGRDAMNNERWMEVPGEEAWWVFRDALLEYVK